MAQFYTLEEAARVLGMSPEELKAKAQQREVRAFLDGGSWRFRVVDIDELARRRGMGSDAELRLSDLEMPTAASGPTEGDLDLSEYQIGVASPDLAQHTMEIPSGSSGSEHDVLLDELALPGSPTGSSSVIIGMDQSTGKTPSDSDVRLVPDNVKGSSDSDVKLASPGFKPPSDSDVTLIADDTSDHGVLTPSSSDTAVRQSPLLGSSAEVKAGDADSDFELTPSSVIDALQPDSGSDFELSALDEGSDEFEATPLAGPSDSDVTAADPGLSGINLSRPSDSGINLQAAAGMNFTPGASSIELAPLSGDDIKSPPPAPAAAAPKAQPGKPKPALSETPPPSARKGEKDIFDDTDFEVDALENEDRTMQLEAASDFELEESDTGSEVFAIDEEDVDQNAATAMGPAVFEEDSEEADEFGEPASGEMASAWDVESEVASSTAERSAPAVALASSGASAEWGPFVFAGLCVSTVFMLICAFIAMDLAMNIYNYQSDIPAAGLVKSIAGLFG